MAKLTTAKEGLNKEFHADGTLRDEYTIKNGMRHGIAKTWHANGQISSEVSFVKDELTGRMRCWDKDGMLMATKYYFRWRPISKRKYLELCESDSSLPRFADEKTSNIFGNYLRNMQKEKREQARGGSTPEQIQQIKVWEKDCEREARQADSEEALAWLTRSKRPERELGEMTKKEAADLIRNLYSNGAQKVWALQIEKDDAGAESSRKLLIKLPKNPKQAGRIYALCANPARPFMDGSGPAAVTSQKFMKVSLLRNLLPSRRRKWICLGEDCLWDCRVIQSLPVVRFRLQTAHGQ